MTRPYIVRAAVKEKTAPAVSLYERRKPRPTKSFLFFILLLVAFLFALHFINFFLQWTVIRLELARGPVFNSPEYTLLGFSLFKQKEIAAIRYFKNSSKPARVFGYFDFCHPAIFAVWNKNEMAFIDFGPVVMAVPAGFSRVSLLPGRVFLLEHENKITLRHFGASPAGTLWHAFLAKKIGALRLAAGELAAVSYVIKELEKSRYLKIPYLLYFYLPLLAIVFLAIRYGLVMLTALFYYAELFFLFDFRKMFVTVPFDWFLRFFKWEIGNGLVEVTASIMVAVFVLGAAFGLWHWKKNSMTGREKGIILFFILLPFFLFF